MKRWGNMTSVLALIIMASVWLGSSCAVNRGPSAEELAAIEAERQRAIAASLKAERAEEEARLAAENEAQRLAEAKRAAAQEEARRIAEDAARKNDALRKEMLALATIYFDYDRSNVRENQRSAMEENARKLREYQPKDLVVVEGHCDERGTIEYNLALGERRAQAVKMYLVDAGVMASRVETVSYGEEKPAVIGSNASSWSKNRRVELVRK